MNRESRVFGPARTLALIAALLMACGAARAQVPVDDEGNPIGTSVPGARVENPTHAEALLTSAELEELVGPVALYPDDLLAIVLPASTYPLEIVQAARFLDQLETDPDLEPDEAWDDSVVALLNYPEVLRMMNDDIDWTWRLGQAVVDQQTDVIAAVESFRDRAYAAGNLRSDRYQMVTRTDDVIEIEPVNDDVIYVPYYEPSRVVVYSPTPAYYYYPRPYPVYYYPYPVGHYYLTDGFFWGVTTAFRIGWWHDYLHVYHHSYHGHPYYGRHYYGSYWRRPSLSIHYNWYVNNHVHVSRDRHRHGDYWRPRYRSGARPVTRVTNNYYYSDRSGSERSRRRGRDHVDRSYRDQRRDGTGHSGRSRPRITAGNGSGRNPATTGRAPGRDPVSRGHASRAGSLRAATDRGRGAVATTRRDGSNRADVRPRRLEPAYGGRPAVTDRTATRRTVRGSTRPPRASDAAVGRAAPSRVLGGGDRAASRPAVRERAPARSTARRSDVAPPQRSAARQSRPVVANQAAAAPARKSAAERTGAKRSREGSRRRKHRQ